VGVPDPEEQSTTISLKFWNYTSGVTTSPTRRLESSAIPLCKLQIL